MTPADKQNVHTSHFDALLQATRESQLTGAQSTLDQVLPEHAARASELESATEAPEATVSAVVQTTLDSTMPEHAARAQELEQADTVSFTISVCV